MKNSVAYDAAIREGSRNGKVGEELFFDLALEDITRAADLFRAVHNRTSGVDGWVSLEVSPSLAHDTKNTLAAAKNLFARAARTNVFIKIPGTAEGLPAIEEAIFAGVPLNVTLLFSQDDMSQHLKHISTELNGESLQVSIQWSSPSLRFSSAAGIWQWLPRCRSISEGNSGSQLLIELTNAIKDCSVPLVGNEQPTSVHMCSDFYGRAPAPKTRSSLTPTGQRTSFTMKPSSFSNLLLREGPGLL